MLQPKIRYPSRGLPRPPSRVGLHKHPSVAHLMAAPSAANADTYEVPPEVEGLFDDIDRARTPARRSTHANREGRRRERATNDVM